jgi:hypothetical protein
MRGGLIRRHCGGGPPRQHQKTCGELGVDMLYYRRRKEYGGLKMDRAKCLKEPERENGQLRRALAALARSRTERRNSTKRI